jgi:pyrimidine-nucleoside phosphorylase
MGAGRSKKGDPINLAVGVVMHGKIGTRFEPGATVATIYADSEAQAELAKKTLESAIEYSAQQVATPPVIHATVGAAPVAR